MNFSHDLQGSNGSDHLDTQHFTSVSVRIVHHNRDSLTVQRLSITRVLLNTCKCDAQLLTTGQAALVTPPP
jgi:hypothetical protein